MTHNLTFLTTLYGPQNLMIPRKTILGKPWVLPQSAETRQRLHAQQAFLMARRRRLKCSTTQPLASLSVVWSCAIKAEGEQWAGSHVIWKSSRPLAQLSGKVFTTKAGVSDLAVTCAGGALPQPQSLLQVGVGSTRRRRRNPFSIPAADPAPTLTPPPTPTPCTSNQFEMEAYSDNNACTAEADPTTTCMTSGTWTKVGTTEYQKSAGGTCTINVEIFLKGASNGDVKARLKGQVSGNQCPMTITEQKERTIDSPGSCTEKT